MKKRILSSILVMAMLLTLVPFQAFAVEVEETPQSSLVLPIIQEGDDFPEPQGLGYDGGISTFSLTPNNPKYIYGYEGVDEMSLWNSKIYLTESGNKPTENGLLQILDSEGAVLASSDAISDYQQDWDSDKQEYSGPYYISGVNFKDTKDISAGVYELRLVAGNNENYSCDTSLCVVGEGTLLLSSASIQNLYSGKDSFEVFLQMYGFEKETDLDSFSMKLLDSNNETIAQSTGNYRDLNGYNNSWSFYGEMKVLQGKTIENNEEYSLQMSFTGAAIMVDGVGAVTQSAYTPDAAISSVEVSDPAKGILSVALEDCELSTTYQVAVTDSSSSVWYFEDLQGATIYGTWEWENNTASNQIEIPLLINGMSVSMKNYPQRLQVLLFEVNSSQYNRYIDKLEYDNPYYNSGSSDGYIRFEPNYVKPTTRSIPFVITCDNGCSSYKGSGDIITLCDQNGNEVGRCSSVTRVDGDYASRFELKGTISISGAITDKRIYNVLLNDNEIDTIYVTSELRNWSSSITGAYDQADSQHHAWTNFGIMSVSTDVINSTGSGRFEIRNEAGSTVLTSTSVNGMTSEYHDHRYFAFDFSSNEVMSHLSDGAKYSIYFKDNNGSETKLRDVVFEAEKVAFDLTNDNHCYFQGGRHYAGTQEVEIVLHDYTDGFRNVSWEEIETELKKVSLVPENGESVTVSSVTRQVGDRSVYLQLSKPLSTGEYSVRYNGTEIRTYTVEEKATSQPPRIYGNDVGSNCTIQGSYLPTASTYTARIFKGYTCVAETFPLTLSGENNGNTQYLRFAKSVIDNLDAGEYKIRVYMDGKVLDEVELNVTAGDLVIIEAYDAHRGYRNNLGMANAIIESGYIAFQMDAGSYTHYRFSEDRTNLANEDYYRISTGYGEQLSEGVGEKTLYVQLKDSAGKESEVYEVKVWRTNGEKLDIAVDETIEGIYSGDTITLTVYTSCPFANAYAEFVEADGNTSVVQLAYDGQNAELTHIFSSTFSIGSDSWDHPNTNNAMVRFYLGTEKHSSEYLSEVVERILVFGDPTYIIMPQFSQYGEVTTNKSSYQIYGYATPNSTVTAAVSGTDYTATANDRGYFSVDLTSLNTGEYKISLRDSNGVTSQQQYTLTVDTTPPTVKDAGFTFNDDGVSAVLRWTCEDQDVEHFEIFKNSTRLGTIYNKSDSGNYVYSVTAQADDGNRFTIKAIDQAGNESSVTISTADTEPPTAPSTAPQLVSKTTTAITLSWGAGSDNMGIAGYNIYNGEEKLAETNGETTTYTLTGLAQGQEYNLTVKTRDRAGLLSDSSAQLVVSTVALSFTQDNLDNIYIVDLYDATKQIPVTAQVSSDEQDYSVMLESAKIEFRAQGAEAWTDGALRCNNGSVNGSWNISGNGTDGFLPVGNYEVRFWATDSNGAIVVSSPVKVVLLKFDDEAPTAPGTPTADSHNTTTITFHWTAAADNVAVDHYDIYRDNEKVGTTQTLSYTDTGLEMGHGYSYTIKAVDKRGNTSVASSAATLSTMELQFDSVITLASSYVMEEQDNKEIAVWAKFKPEEGYAPAVTMAVEYKLSTSSAWSSANLTVNQNDKNRFIGKLPLGGSETGYLPAGDYSVRFAVTDGSATAYSDTQTVSLQRDTTPPTVSSLTPDSGIFGGKEIQLNISATDNVGVDRIVLAYAPKGSTNYSEITAIDNESNGKSFSTSYTWDASGLSSGEYTIKATAYDIRNNAGEIEKTITIDNTPPTVPTGLTVTGTSRYIYVVWDKYTAPSDFSAFKVYRADREDGDYTCVSTISTIGYYDDGESATAGVTYFYYVTAVDKYGNESESTQIGSASFVTDIESPQISDFRPAENSTLCKEAALSVMATDNYRLSKAVFEYRAAGSGSWQEIAVVEVPSVTNNTVFRHTWNLSGLATGTYEVRVSVYDDSVNAVIEGKYEANAPAVLTRTVQVRQYTAPVAPQVVATSGYKTVSLNWTYGGDESLLSTYIVYRATTESGNFVPVKRLSPTVTSYQDSIPVNITYYYKVEAIDRFDASAESAVHSAASVGTDTQAPTAVIIPETLLSAVDVPFRFSGVNSSDNDVIASYSWDFGDGSSSSNEVTPLHQYSSEGTFTVKLTVTDECGNSNTTTATMTVVDVTKEDADFTLVSIQVIDAERGVPAKIANALLNISSGADGAEAISGETGSDGLATVLLPVGQHTISITADGYLPSTKTIQVTSGENGRMQTTIGLSKTSLVAGQVTATEMTLDEIKSAGIDINDPDNQHVYKFEVVLHFTAGLKEYDIPYTLGYKNEAGKFYNFPGGWLPDFGDDGTMLNLGIFPTAQEGFYLVIYGEAHWLKEMYNVELLVLNRSTIDTIENCTAELVLPDGLSLATMLSQQQTEKISMDSIAPGVQSAVRWYVRGDKEGEYKLTANVSGELVSGAVSESFETSFTTDKPVKVYAGSALKLTITAEDMIQRGKDYTVTFRLTNVSDKTLYNLSFGLTKIEQFQVLEVTKKSGTNSYELPLDGIELGDSKTYKVGELAPGGYIEISASTTIQFFSMLEAEVAVTKQLLQQITHTAFLGSFIDVAYYLEDVSVISLEGSTTTIPHEVIINRAQRENLIEKTINEMLNAAFADQLKPLNFNAGSTFVDLATGWMPIPASFKSGAKSVLKLLPGETNYTFNITLDDGKMTEDSIYNEYVSISTGNSAQQIVSSLNGTSIKVKAGEVSFNFRAPGNTKIKIGVENSLGEQALSYILDATVDGNKIKGELELTPTSETKSYQVNEEKLTETLAFKQEQNKETFLENPFQIFDSELEFSVSGQTADSQYSVSMTADSLAAIGKSYTTKVTYNGAVAQISFDQDAIDTIIEQVETHMTVSAQRLSQEETAALGTEHPTYLLAVTTGEGEKISNFGEGMVYVSIPYEPQPGKTIVIEHIKEDNSVELIYGSYNEETQCIEFSTKEFSYFVIRELDGEILTTEPTIMGDVNQIGSVLTASVPGVDSGELVYKWYRNDDFTTPIAEGPGYALAYEDSNASISVRASGTVAGKYDSEYYTQYTVKAGKFPVSGVVTVSLAADLNHDGAINVGDTLSATITPDVTVTYQWSNNGEAILGATSSTYVVAEGDQLITVTVTPRENYTGTLTSAAVEVGKSVLAGTVTITGTAAVGSELTVGISAGDATGDDYTITWLRDEETISATSDSTYVITKNDQGKTISVKITAKGDRYTGEIVSTGIAIPAAVPDAPTVSASAGNGQVTITWTAPDGNGSPITGYTVQKNAETPIAIGAGSTSYTFTGLNNGTTYTFKVVALNTIGSSEAGTVSGSPKAPSYSGGGSSTAPIVGKPEVSSDGQGTVVVEKDNSVTITPAKDNRITGVIVNGKRVSIPKDGKLIGLKPTDKVEVVFEPIRTVDLTTYTDVSTRAWYTEAVRYAVEHGIFYGTSDTTFAPNASMTRGMLATVLHRIDGTPDGKLPSFNDVADKQYYTAAVGWAAENCIVSGYGNGAFGPNDPITREQLVTMLWRYAGSPTAQGRLDLHSRFSDAGDISRYAQDATRWAVEQGIITGYPNGTFNPKGQATRAEVATIIKRFLANLEY